MKYNSIQDFLCCGKFLIEEKIVHENKLAAWGYSAGGLLVASAINACPELFRAALLKVCIYPILCYFDSSSSVLFFSCGCGSKVGRLM